MHTATITLKKIWAPFQPSDKRTNVEDTSGKKWRVDVETIGQFSEGDACIIGFTQESFRGKSFDLVKNIRLAELTEAPHGPAVVKAGNGNGEIDIRSIFGLMHSYNGKLPSISQMVQDLRNAREALDLFERNVPLEYADDVGGTLE